MISLKRMLKELGLKLNPLTRLKIYNVAKRLVLQKMNNNFISPDRAKEIIIWLKETVPKIQTAQMAQEFYENAGKVYAELTELPAFFQSKEEEKTDEVVVVVGEKLMPKNFDTATQIIEQFSKIQNKKDKETFIEQLQSKFPSEFDEAVEEIIQKNIFKT